MIAFFASALYLSEMTPAQCRAARALLDWSQQRLAESARVSDATIRNFEGGKSAPQNATLDVLCRALESAGVIFVEENGAGPGVRLRKGG
jgi:transcriptional regulator with XRE-family HTH domain